MTDQHGNQLYELRTAPQPASCGLAGHYRADRRRAERPLSNYHYQQCAKLILHADKECTCGSTADRRRADAGWCPICELDEQKKWAKRNNDQWKEREEYLEAEAQRLQQQLVCVKGGYEIVQQENQRLREALEEARKVLVTACGETAPYIRIALQRIDAALAGGKENNERRTTGSPAPASE